MKALARASFRIHIRRIETDNRSICAGASYGIYIQIDKLAGSGLATIDICYGDTVIACGGVGDGGGGAGTVGALPRIGVGRATAFYIDGKVVVAIAWTNKVAANLDGM